MDTFGHTSTVSSAYHFMGLCGSIWFPNSVHDCFTSALLSAESAVQFFEELPAFLFPSLQLVAVQS